MATFKISRKSNNLVVLRIGRLSGNLDVSQAKRTLPFAGAKTARHGVVPHHGAVNLGWMMLGFTLVGAAAQWGLRRDWGR